MKDSTKAIFDSSWRVFNGLIVETEDGVEIASVGSTTDAHRIARLPELYDALMEAAGAYCPNIRNAEYPLEKCDDCGGEDCLATKWIDLLKKVRDGK